MELIIWNMSCPTNVFCRHVESRSYLKVSLMLISIIFVLTKLVSVLSLTRWIRFSVRQDRHAVFLLKSRLSAGQVT